MADHIDCREALDHLQDYLKREMTPELAVEVKQHLERCRPCLNHARFEESFLIMLSTHAGRATCPEVLRARIVAALRAATDDVDAAHFRQLLGHFATGVTVVTALTPGGQPIGMTVNSLASVSLQPPLVLMCIDRQAEAHDVLLEAREFVVNVLAHDQEVWSRRFADQHEERFDGVGYRTSPRGLIVLEGALAYFECRHYADYPGGDHTIILGEVMGGEAGSGRPLLFYRGGYTGLE
jgi:anti-sigma factor (TIGR02949 family)